MSIEFDIKCSVCGNDLKFNIFKDANNIKVYVNIDPCQICLDKENDNGFEMGRNNILTGGR